MKNCAIVCEYDPFHSGHKYQMDAAKELGAGDIFCVMSGQFVQSAMPAFCDKSIRAECAVLGGASAVIELPVMYATAGAQYFAEGAVRIAAGIKNVTHIVMGATAPSDLILRLAEYKMTDGFSSRLKSLLKSGKSFNSACVEALIGLYGDESCVINAFSDPNNLLCIEYICAMNNLAPNLSPLIIERRGGKYGELSLNEEHASATAIRAAFARGKADAAKQFIPYKFYEICDFAKAHSPDIALYKNIAVFMMKKQERGRIATFRDCSEGLEHLIKNAPPSCSYDSYVQHAAGKRYGAKRIRRLLLDCVLDITADMLSGSFVTRLLACKSDLDFSSLPDFVKAENSTLKAACENSEVRAALNADINASALYSTLCGLDGDYFNYSLVKV